MQHALRSVAGLTLLSSVVVCAQDLRPDAPAATADGSSNQDPISDSNDSGWVRAWMRIAAKARASQPGLVAKIR
jgi:hypothetical protein